jgi:excisionase family DNA binding protein
VRLYTLDNVKEIAMSNSQPILSEFLTTQELATELGLNKRTLDRWHALGTGPPRTRVGRKVLYRRTSVQKWLAVQQQSPAV